MDIVMRFVLLIYQIGSRAASLSDLYSLLDVSTLCVSLSVCVFICPSDCLFAATLLLNSYRKSAMSVVATTCFAASSI